MADPQVLGERDWLYAQYSQSACNASGLIYSLKEVADKVHGTLRAEGRDDTKNFAEHPVIRAYVAQLAYLCFHATVDMDLYHQMYVEIENALASYNQGDKPNQ